MMLETPILLLVFNRPEQALKVLEQIRQQRPERLFIAADGPRPGKAGEEHLCRETRKALLEGVDWSCDVQTLFRPKNLGCGKAVSSAVSWFFECVEEGIILEDDCVPDPTFFSFCEEMLAHYRTDPDVMHINGSNYQEGKKRGKGSYYFSRYAHVWGWASWRRAWKQYDFTLERYKDRPITGLNPMLQQEFRHMLEKKIDTWDIQWFMAVWFSDGWVITPNVCLVRNTGYGKEATHTSHTPGWFKKIVYGTMPVIIHPAQKKIDTAADRFVADTVYAGSGMYVYLKKIIRSHPLLYKICKRIAVALPI